MDKYYILYINIYANIINDLKWINIWFVCGCLKLCIILKKNHYWFGSILELIFFSRNNKLLVHIRLEFFIDLSKCFGTCVQTVSKIVCSLHNN